MLPDGLIEKYSTKFITDNICSQLDEGGYRYTMIYDINYKCNIASEINKNDTYITIYRGRKKSNFNMKGW